MNESEDARWAHERRQLPASEEEAVERIGVVGCGLMASGVAEVCARKDVDVIVVELDTSSLESGFATAEDIDTGMVEGSAHPMGPLPRMVDAGLLGRKTRRCFYEYAKR